jgi:CHASE2 domain-containing sensor protein
VDGSLTQRQVRFRHAILWVYVVVGTIAVVCVAVARFFTFWLSFVPVTILFLLIGVGLEKVLGVEFRGERDRTDG